MPFCLSIQKLANLLPLYGTKSRTGKKKEIIFSDRGLTMIAHCSPEPLGSGDPLMSTSQETGTTSVHH